MECAHCGISLGRVPWQQHICELCLRVIEGGAICHRCRRVTYQPEAGLCPGCHTDTLEPKPVGFDEPHEDEIDVYDDLSEPMADLLGSRLPAGSYSDGLDDVLERLGMHEPTFEDD